MELIGMFDSPYVRRVAISLKQLALAFDHRSLSVFQNMEEFSLINPLVKAPTLVCDDGTVLIDSTLILDYIEELAEPDKSLMPDDPELRLKARQLIGIAWWPVKRRYRLSMSGRCARKQNSISHGLTA